jgi:hypothetical protein
MIVPLRHLLGWILSALSSREDLILENLALRQGLSWFRRACHRLRIRCFLADHTFSPPIRWQRAMRQDSCELFPDDRSNADSQEFDRP